MVTQILAGAMGTQASLSPVVDTKEYRCEACWVSIPREERDAYLESGLCKPCDARLNPYPRQPHQDDPRWPTGLIC